MDKVIDLARVRNSQREEITGNKEFLLLEIQHIIDQLVEIYQTTDNLADQQYIFTKFKEILRVTEEERLDVVKGIVFKAMLNITRQGL